MSITKNHPGGHVSPLLPVQIEYNGRSFSARLGSLSPEGALLETHGLTVPVGMRVILSFTLARRSWQIPASITHTTPHEIGLLFSGSQYALYAQASRAELPPVSPLRTRIDRGSAA
ncbi:MAG: hypothetical protein OQL28_13865 [Sedimenticola sp.]|nr:hypothetical protein [Sedimenticola sp.]